MTEDFTFQHEQHDYCPLTGERCNCYRTHEACLNPKDPIAIEYAKQFNKMFGRSR